MGFPHQAHSSLGTQQPCSLLMVPKSIMFQTKDLAPGAGLAFAQLQESQASHFHSTRAKPGSTGMPAFQEPTFLDQ